MCLTNRQRHTIVSALLALTLLLISCDLSTLLGPAVPPPVPGAVNTIVVLTAEAAGTQTAAAIPPTWTPTFTPSPTRTPTITPSPTPTFLFFVFTRTSVPQSATAGAPGDYQCSLTGQTPADGTTFSKGESFQTTWTVKNTGSVAWDTNTVDFAYVSGTNFASIKLADLPKSVAIGKSIGLRITMTAPSTSGSYQTTWGLQQGNNRFCKVTLSIVVK
ncbi:MAG TPA: NBR1-Ig-like domain-containing protein [Anaerolineales bacterium]